jgi:hypothetical protein
MPQTSKKHISDLTCRVLKLIECKTSGSKHLKMMEELTGISSERWKAISAKKQNVTIEILEVVCKTWPQHAFWLATGIEDSSTGHTNPELRESRQYEIEDVAAEIFEWKLNRKYEPEKLFGLMKKSVDAKNWKDYKSFADLFDDNGFISKLDISMRVLAWLTKEEELRPEYELEILRMLFMENAPVNTRVEEVFFDWKEGQDSSKLKLHEPYLSQVLRLKKAASNDKNIDVGAIKKT